MGGVGWNIDSAQSVTPIIGSGCVMNGHCIRQVNLLYLSECSSLEVLHLLLFIAKHNKLSSSHLDFADSLTNYIHTLIQQRNSTTALLFSSVFSFLLPFGPWAADRRSSLYRVEHIRANFRASSFTRQNISRPEHFVAIR